MYMRHNHRSYTHAPWGSMTAMMTPITTIGRRTAATALHRQRRGPLAGKSAMAAGWKKEVGRTRRGSWIDSTGLRATWVPDLLPACGAPVD